MKEIDRTRLMVTREIEDLGGGLEGNIDDVIAKLITIKEKAARHGFHDVTIDLETQGYNDWFNFSVNGRALEDDSTYSNRIAILEEEAKEKAERQKERDRKKQEKLEKQKASELHQLEFLAKKFGKTIQ